MAPKFDRSHEVVYSANVLHRNGQWRSRLLSSTYLKGHESPCTEVTPLHVRHLGVWSARVSHVISGLIALHQIAQPWPLRYPSIRSHLAHVSCQQLKQFNGSTVWLWDSTSPLRLGQSSEANWQKKTCTVMSNISLPLVFSLDRAAGCDLSTKKLPACVFFFFFGLPRMISSFSEVLPSEWCDVGGLPSALESHGAELIWREGLAVIVWVQQRATVLGSDRMARPQ